MFRKTLFGSTYLDRRALLFDGEGDGAAGGAGTGNDAGNSGGGSGGGGAGGNGGEGGGGLAANSDASRSNDGGNGEGGAGEGGAGGAAASSGEGEGAAKPQRPEGLADQFWDAEKGEVRIDALHKAFTDTKAAHDKLLNEQGEKGGVPEKAEGYFDTDLVTDEHFRLPEGELAKTKDIYPDGVPLDDPLLSGMAEVAHKAGLTKAQFLDMAGGFFLAAEQAMPEALDVEAEVKLLGDNGKDRVDAYVSWVDRMSQKGDGEDDRAKPFNETDRANLIAFGTTASEIQTLEKVMALVAGDGNNPAIINQGSIGEGLPTYEEWYAQIPSQETLGRAPTDADWQKWSRQGEELFGTRPGGSSMPGVGMPASQGAITNRSGDQQQTNRMTARSNRAVR